MSDAGLDEQRFTLELPLSRIFEDPPHDAG
jgi:hypothetical protein